MNFLKIEKAMCDWTGQLGFPLITVDLESESDDEINLNLSQVKFSAIEGKSSNSTTIWNCPIKILTPSGEHDILFDKKESIITVPGTTKASWIMLNSNSAGFYHVQYSPQLFDRLLKNVQNFSTIDRLKISSDMYCLTRAGLESSVKFLQLFESYNSETEYSVLSDIIAGVDALKPFAAHIDKTEELNQIIKNTISKAANQLGWDAKSNEAHSAPLLRSLLIRQLGLAGDPETVSKAKEKFSDIKNGTGSVDPNLVSTIFSIVAANTDSLQDLFDLHSSYQLQEERDRIERSIGCVKKREHVEKIINFTFSGAVRTGDIPGTLSCLAGGSKDGLEMVWEVIKTKIDFLKEKLSGQFLLSGMLKSILSKFYTMEKMKEVEEFFQANPVPNATMAIKQGLENVQIKAQWLQRDEQALKQFLSK